MGDGRRIRLPSLFYLTMIFQCLFVGPETVATLYILATAIRNAASTDAAAIRDALAETQAFPTLLGNFSFDPNGEVVYTPIIQIVKDGELQVME